MYNRYIPSADGTYRRQTVAREQSVADAAAPSSLPVRPTAEKRSPSQPDLSDLLIVLILLLVLSESDGSDSLGVLLTLAAFLLLP